jgi:hypothetical protein
MKFESMGIKNKEVLKEKPQVEKVSSDKEDLLEKKIEEEILPLFRILEDNQELFEKNKKEFIEKLFKDVEYIEETEGRLVPSPDYTAKKMKEVLITRLKNAIQDSENNYNGKKKIDYELVKKAKIILLSEKDDSFLKKKYSLGIDEDWSATSLFNYLGISRYDSKVEKLNGEEIKALIRGGLGHNLVKIAGYDYIEHIKETPDEYIQILIKEKNRDVDFENIFKKTASPLGYSLETAKALKENDNTYTIMRNLELFEKSINVEFIKSLFAAYSPQYPYHLEDCLGYLNKLHWDENKKNELKDFIYKNNYVTEKTKELEGKYKEVDEDIKSITRKNNESWRKVTPDSLSEEQLGQLKKHIEDGYITLFYEDNEYIKYFSINDYDWLISQIEKNNQENLLLVCRGDIIYKPEDQRRYAKKLLEKNQFDILQKLIKEGRFSNNIFNNDDFNILKEKELNPEKNIRLFSSLGEENFEVFKEDESNKYRYDSFLINYIEKFDFENEKYEKEKSYKEFIAYVDKCFNNNTEKFISYFYEKFSFENYDITKKDELIKYVSDLSLFLEKITHKAYSYQFEKDKDYDWTKVGTAILDKDTHFQNAPLEQCLGQEEYDTLKNYGIKLDSYSKISFFNGLSEETFESLITESTTWSTYSAMIKRFKLPKDSIYLKIYNETSSIGGSHELQEYYFKNYSKLEDITRQRTLKLIKDAQFANKEDLIFRYVKRFENYDLESLKYNELISKIKNTNTSSIGTLQVDLFDKYLDVLENKDLSKDFSDVAGFCGVIPEYVAKLQSLDENEKIIFQNIFPWSESLLKMEGFQKQSNNKQHNPWVQSFVPLIQTSVNEKIIDLNNPQDGNITLDFVKRFGMKNIPKLFELFVKIKRFSNLESIDDEMKKILIDDFNINVNDLLKNDKNNINLILNQIEKFQLELFNKFLNEDHTILEKSLNSEYVLDMIETIKGNSGFNHNATTKEVIKKYLEESKQNPEKFKLPNEYREMSVEIPELSHNEGDIDDLVKNEKEKILNNSELNLFLDLQKDILRDVTSGKSIERYCEEEREKIKMYFKKGIDELRINIGKEEEKIDRNEKMLIGLRGRLDRLEKQSNGFNKEFSVISDKNITDILEIVQELIPEEFEGKKEILLNLSTRDIYNKIPDGFNQLSEGFENSNKEVFIERLANFIGNHVREHYLNKKHGEDDALNSENKNLIKALKKHWGTTDFEKSILSVMNNKLNDLENGQLGDKKRPISFIPSKGLMRIFSGDLGGACTSNQNMRLAQGEFENTVSYSLVLDRGNPKNERFVGSFLVIEAETEDGEKAIVLRANNPAENIFNMMNGNILIDEIIKEFKALAERRGIKNLVVPMTQGVASNRSQVANYYSKIFKKDAKVGLVNNPETNFNGYSIWNKDSNNYVVRI